MSSRQGTCATCNEPKWLLRKDPPTCSSCWHSENPEAAAKGGRSKGKRTKKPEKSKPRSKRARGSRSKKAKPPGRSRRKPEAPPPPDEIEREAAAIMACGRALDGLSREAMERVLFNVAHRFREQFGGGDLRARLMIDASDE